MRRTYKKTYKRSNKKRPYRKRRTYKKSSGYKVMSLKRSYELPIEFLFDAANPVAFTDIGVIEASLSGLPVNSYQPFTNIYEEYKINAFSLEIFKSAQPTLIDNQTVTSTSDPIYGQGSCQWITFIDRNPGVPAGSLSLQDFYDRPAKKTSPIQYGHKRFTKTWLQQAQYVGASTLSSVVTRSKWLDTSFVTPPHYGIRLGFYPGYDFTPAGDDTITFQFKAVITLYMQFRGIKSIIDT